MHSLVMTGATRGIGLIAAQELLRRDRDLHLVILARGAGPAGFADRLRAISDHVTVIDTDLADVASIQAGAARILQLVDDGTLPPLTGFAGNAGVQFVDNVHVTRDGLETTFAVNIYANHLLIDLLRHRFVTPARVVITVSDTHFGDFRHTGGLVPAPQWTSPEAIARPSAFPQPETVTAGRMAYSTSKLGAIYLVHEWARRLPDGVDIVSYNPSLVPGTGLAREASRRDQFVNRWILPVLALTPFADRITPAGRKLADAIVGTVVAPSGAYIDRTREVPSSEESYDPVRERALWDYLQSLAPANA